MEKWRVLPDYDNRLAVDSLGREHIDVIVTGLDGKSGDSQGSKASRIKHRDVIRGLS
ncbi:hypothetical protein Ddye_029223 [Dipteronia dyeriana]|uniref:Uncharacterized protein n=1 Tax=Dipteronia dyeriana TaxID=168575 RepID=A0AAD9TET6_9ROSI|nr:hypothetical protein Ddye_029223 [Dipteronia dyeriana]